MKKRRNEDMMVRGPGPSPASPDFKEMMARELEKMRAEGKLTPIIYARARDLLPVLYPSIFNMFYRQDSNLQRAIAFLLRQASRALPTAS